MRFKVKLGELECTLKKLGVLVEVYNDLSKEFKDPLLKDIKYKTLVRDIEILERKTSCNLLEFYKEGPNKNSLIYLKLENDIDWYKVEKLK